jgi:hypothetical protein
VEAQRFGHSLAEKCPQVLTGGPLGNQAEDVEADVGVVVLRPRREEERLPGSQLDDQRRGHFERRVGGKAFGGVGDAGLQLRVLHVGQRRLEALELQEVVVVDKAAGVRQQLLDRDLVSVRKGAGQPLLDGVVELERPLLRELKDHRRRPDLADALQPEPGIGWHRRPGLGVGDAGRTDPCPLWAPDVGGDAWGRAIWTGDQAAENPRWR